MFNTKEILAIFKKYPRTGSLLPVTEEKRQQILKEAAYQPFLAEIRAEGDRLRQKPIPAIPYSKFKLYEETGDRAQYQDYYYESRDRLATMALLSWLYEKEEDISALEDCIWSVCDEYTWARPAHLGGKGLSRLETDGYTVDLFASETGCALCEIIELNKDKLAPIVIARAQHTVHERIFDGMLKRPFHWETGTNNWSAVCAGNVAIAALYLADDELLAALLARTEPAIHSYLSGFPDDGTGLEGISYWTYGFSYFTAYAEMVRRCTHGEINWFNDPRAKKAALFQQKAYLKHGNMIKFADCNFSDTAHWWGLTSFLKTVYSEVESLPRPYFSAYTLDPCFRWVINLRDLAWSDLSLPAMHEPTACYALPDAQWLIGNAENADISLAAKGGSNSEPHNHNDVGSFQFFKNGDEILCELGGGVYCRNYFNAATRYDIINCGSQGHSVPVIDGQYQKFGEEYAARHVTLGEWFIEMDMAPAYGNDNLLSLIRRIAFDSKTGRTTLTDTFTFKEAPSSVTERFVTLFPVAIGENAAAIQGEHAQASLTFDADALVPALHTEPFFDHERHALQANLLDFTFRTARTTCTCTFTIA